MTLLPILFKIGGFTLYTYGFLMAVAFLVAIVLALFELKRKGMETDLAYDLGLYAVVGGIGGARLTYVAAHFREFIGNPLTALAIWQGGLIFYGGLAGGALAIFLLIWRRGLPIGKVADVIAPGAAIGSGIGRLGCFFNGCCYGLPTKLPFGITFSDAHSAAPLGVPLYPTQLLEFAYDMLIFVVLWSMRKKVDDDGFVFWLFLGMYGFFRFVVEFLRVRPIVLFGLGGSQLFSLVLIVSSVAVIGLRYLGKQDEVSENANA